MAGAEFDADDPLYDDEGLSFSPEEIQANLPGGEIDKARLILERYIRDFSRSVEKKIISLESTLTQFEGKKAPTAQDLAELEQTVTLLLEKEIARLSKLDIQLEKEFDGIETRLKTQGGTAGDYLSITDARDKLETLISSAQTDFLDLAADLIERGKKRLQDIEDEQLRLETEAASKQRLILDRYVNDLTKSYEKKFLAAEMRLEAFALREPPRTDDPQRLKDLVDVMVQKQITIVNQQIAQMDKEYEALRTRLATQGGTQADFDKIEAERKKLNDLLTKSAQQLTDAGEEIKNRGLDKINARRESQFEKEAREEAQRAGEKVFEEYLQANKQQLEPTLKEFTTAILGDLIGPYSAIRKDNDGRYERRESLLKEAEERARQEAQRVFEEVLDEKRKTAGIPAPAQQSDVDFATPRAPQGFQLQDIPSMARFVRGSGPFVAAVAAAQIQSFLADRAIQFGRGGTDPNQSITQSANNLTAGLGPLGGAIPFNVGGRILEAMLTQTEQIAENTSKDLMAFSGDILTSNLNARLRMLELNMERATNPELTRSIAAITDMKTELKTALTKASDELLIALAPLLIGIADKATITAGLLGEHMGKIRFLIQSATTSPDPITNVVARLVDYFWGEGEARLKKLQADRENQGASAVKEFSEFIRNNKANPNPNVPKNIRV